MSKYIAIILLVFPGSAFADTTTYICDYPTYSNQEGNHKIENKFVLSFVVDTENDKSYMVGNNGSAEVIKFETGNRISFLEITETRNLMTTTIDKDLYSVHSRNKVIRGELIPSQYYGKCEKK